LLFCCNNSFYKKVVIVYYAKRINKSAQSQILDGKSIVLWMEFKFYYQKFASIIKKLTTRLDDRHKKVTFFDDITIFLVLSFLKMISFVETIKVFFIVTNYFLFLSLSTSNFLIDSCFHFCECVCVCWIQETWRMLMIDFNNNNNNKNTTLHLYIIKVYPVLLNI
jgi:hypothetical protein